jgi:hypothetical protein
MKKSLAVAALAAVAAVGMAAPAVAGVNPDLNKTSYWESLLPAGSTCVKTELSDGTHTLSVPSGTALLVIKAGTVVTDYWGPSSYYPYTSDKDISFYIICTTPGGPIS